MLNLRETLRLLMREKPNLGLVYIFIYGYSGRNAFELWSNCCYCLMLCFLLLDQIVSFYENVTRGLGWRGTHPVIDRDIFTIRSFYSIGGQTLVNDANAHNPKTNVKEYKKFGFITPSLLYPFFTVKSNVAFFFFFLTLFSQSWFMGVKHPTTESMASIWLNVAFGH